MHALNLFIIMVWHKNRTTIYRKPQCIHSCLLRQIENEWRTRTWDWSPKRCLFNIVHKILCNITILKCGYVDERETKWNERKAPFEKYTHIWWVCWGHLSYFVNIKNKKYRRHSPIADLDWTIGPMWQIDKVKS